MSFCPQCGLSLPPGAVQCPQCGLPLNTQPNGQQGYNPPPSYNTVQNQQPYPPQNPYPPMQQPYGNPYQQPILYGSRKLNVGMLVWSIILMVSTYGFVFGLIALIMTILAKDEVYAQGEQKKLNTAKILNIIGTVLAGIALLVVIFASFLILMAEPYYYY